MLLDNIGKLSYNYEYSQGKLIIKRTYAYATGSLGAQISKIENDYDAWGNILNSVTNDVLKANPFRYRGYYYDSETGLYYLNSRYYDPEIGRFISPDGISYLDPETLGGLNLYAYCGNNPVMYVDPTGHDWDWGTFWKGLAIAFVVVAGVAAVIVSGGIATGAIAGGMATFANAVTTITLGIASGGLVGGYMQEAQGGSFWAGWIGGAINGGIQSILQLRFGSIGIIVGGPLGSCLGTVTMQVLDSKYTEGYYKSPSQILENAYNAAVASAVFSLITAYTGIMVGDANKGTLMGGDIYNGIPGSAITPAFKVLFPAFYSIIDDILSYLCS